MKTFLFVPKQKVLIRCAGFFSFGAPDAGTVDAAEFCIEVSYLSVKHFSFDACVQSDLDLMLLYKL
jgi:hypothetical protein